MRINMKPASVIEAELGIQNGGPVHAFFTAECARQMDRFVPRRKGTLAETVVLNGQVTDKVGVDYIHYDQPYASYQYYGVRNDGTHKISHWTTPGTGPYWDQRMWTAKKYDLIQAVQNYVDTHGGK